MGAFSYSRFQLPFAEEPRCPAPECSLTATQMIHALAGHMNAVDNQMINFVLHY